MIQPIALSLGAAFAALNLDVDLFPSILFSKPKVTEEEVNNHRQIKWINNIIERWKESSMDPPEDWEIEGL